MRYKWSLSAASCLLSVTFGAPLYAQSAEHQSAAHKEVPATCREVEGACRSAGFIDKGSNEGKGLWSECIEPIMQGRPQSKAAKLPLPKVSPNTVSACKSEDSSYGQGGRPKQK